MAQQKRFPLLLNLDYPPERQVLDVVRAVSDGERAGILRTLVVLGHSKIESELANRKAAAAQQGEQPPASGDS